MTAMTPADLASMKAEIEAKIRPTGVGAITAVVLRQVLLDTLAVLDAVAIAAAVTATDAEVASLTPGLLLQAGQAGQAAGAAVVTQQIQTLASAAGSTAGQTAGTAAGTSAGQAAAQGLVATEASARQAATAAEVSARQAGDAAILTGGVNPNVITAAMLKAGAAAANLGAGGVTASLLASGAALGNLTNGSLPAALLAPTSISDGQLGLFSATKALFRSTASGAALAISTDIQTVVASLCNVASFGAVGDGGGYTLANRFATLAAAKAVYPRAVALTESINGHAIQAAIDWVRASFGGGGIRIPAGTYNLAGFSLDLTGSNTRLIGDGINSTVLDIAHVSQYAIYSSDQGLWNGLEDLTVTSTVTRGVNPLIYWTNERRLFMKRVKLTGYVNGMTFVRFECVTLLDCHFDNPGNSGGGNALQLGVNDGVQRGANISIINCFFRGMNSLAGDAPRGTIGVLAYDVDAIFMLNTDISGFTDHSVFIAPQNRGQNHYFDQCFFDATANGHSFYVAGAGVHAQWQFTGCWFAGAGRARASGSPTAVAGSSDGCGFYLDKTGVVQDINFSGCRFFLNAGCGAFIGHASADCNFDGCTFYYNGGISNTFKNGLWINPQAVQTVGMNISGCKFSGNAADDVRAEANAQFNNISSCVMNSGGLTWIGYATAGRFAFANVDGVTDGKTTNYPAAFTLSPCLSGSRMNVTGAASIARLDPTYPGHEVTILFYDAMTVVSGSDATQNIRLRGGNFVTANGSMIRLMCWDDATWREVLRAS